MPNKTKRGQPPISPGDPLRSTNVNLPESFYKRISKLIEKGRFKSQSDALRQLVEIGLNRSERD